MKQVKFLKPIGNMKSAGGVYIKNLHGCPDAWVEKYGKDDWWWKEGTREEDCCFLHGNVINQCIKDKEAKVIF